MPINFFSKSDYVITFSKPDAVKVALNEAVKNNSKDGTITDRISRLAALRFLTQKHLDTKLMTFKHLKYSKLTSKSKSLSSAKSINLSVYRKINAKNN